jgi:Metal-dependent amidase/aminoacylase/carboxypeptidase
MAVLTEDALIKIRRDLHQIPELALNEVQTSAYLEKVIASFESDPFGNSKDS